MVEMLKRGRRTIIFCVKLRVLTGFDSLLSLIAS